MVGVDMEIWVNSPIFPQALKTTFLVGAYSDLALETATLPLYNSHIRFWFVGLTSRLQQGKTFH